MKAVMLTLSLLLVAGCSDTYRYPCQDPANWKKEECNRPACEADGMCWDTLSGVDPKEVQETPSVEPTAAPEENAAEPTAAPEEHAAESEPSGE